MDRWFEPEFQTPTFMLCRVRPEVLMPSGDNVQKIDPVENERISTTPLKPAVRKRRLYRNDVAMGDCSQCTNQ